MRQILIIVLIFVPFSLLGQKVKVFSIKTDLGDFRFEKGSGSVKIVPLRQGFFLSEDTLSPALPCIGVNVLVSPTEEYSELSFKEEETLVMSDVDIALPQKPLPTGRKESISATINVNYTKANYPTLNVEYSGTHLLGGYKLLSFIVCPFRYDAIQKRLYLKRNMTISVRLKQTPFQKEKKQIIKANNMADIVGNMIVNKDELATLYSGSTRNTNISSRSISYPYKYIIVTADSLSQAFEKLAMWKTIKGVKTKIVTIEECHAQYPNDTPQLAIKKVLTAYYADGMEFALLGGDSNIVPAQICALPFHTKDSYQTPADLFYSCLDNDPSWDSNGNGIYAESTDYIDIAPEFILTRLPVSSSGEVENYVNRVIEYESNPRLDGWENKLLSFGNIIASYRMKDGQQISDAQYYGEDVYTNEVEINWNGYMFELYDTYTSHPNGANYVANATHIQEELAKGYAFADEYSHGWTHAWGGMEDTSVYTIDEASILVNSGYTTITTTACYTNSFDLTPTLDSNPLYATCLSESFIRNPHSGVLAYYGSSREGWSSISPKYQKAFYHCLFNSSNQQFGRSAVQSKLTYIGSNSNYYRWLTLTINPVGDAEMPLYLDTPHSMDNVSVSFNNGQVNVSTGIDSCRICVSSVADGGDSYFEFVELENTAQFTGVDEDCYLCISKPGYIPYLARVGTNVYLQNESIFRNLPIFSTNTYAGRNITSSKPQGPVVIESGKVTNTSQGSFTIQNNLEVKIGASLEIKKSQ